MSIVNSQLASTASSPPTTTSRILGSLPRVLLVPVLRVFSSGRWRPDSMFDTCSYYTARSEWDATSGRSSIFSGGTGRFLDYQSIQSVQPSWLLQPLVEEEHH